MTKSEHSCEIHNAFSVCTIYTLYLEVDYSLQITNKEYLIQCSGFYKPTLHFAIPLYFQQINADGRYKKIHLAGYSFGACVAFEMGVQLKKQAEGAAVEVVSLTLLDGSHSYVSNQYRQAHNRFGKGNQAVMEAEALCALVSQFFADGIIEVIS